jgi:Zn finger protein HypA/HybF involved in hydrogenase expression
VKKLLSGYLSLQPTVSCGAATPLHRRREAAQQVVTVRLLVGEFTGGQAASCQEAFAILAPGTLLETAEVERHFFPGTTIEVMSCDIE